MNVYLVLSARLTMAPNNQNNQCHPIDNKFRYTHITAKTEVKFISSKDIWRLNCVFQFAVGTTLVLYLRSLTFWLPQWPIYFLVIFVDAFFCRYNSFTA
jgi:hypothetical protein